MSDITGFSNKELMVNSKNIPINDSDIYLEGSKVGRTIKSKRYTSSKSINDINIDISIQLLEESDEIDGHQTSYSKIKFKGETINYVIMNTLRRVILTLIPVYGFNIENINITKNTSVFHNDYMRLRLSNFPIYLTKELNEKYKRKKNINRFNILNDESTLEKMKELEYKANLGSAEIDTTSDILNKQDISNNLTITVNVKNISDTDIMNVMTNTLGVKFYYGKEQISHIYSKPLLIVQLQPGQEFTCSMISNLNIGIYNATYSPCSICCYEENNENDYDFKIMSRRQISEKDILIRACSIIQMKLKNSREIFKTNIMKYNSEEYMNNKMDDENISTEHLRNGIIVIEGEQHTLGNLISRYLQDHNEITYAGYKVGHPNVSQVDIKYKCNTNILPVLDDVITKLDKIYEKIKMTIEKMPDFGYKYV